MYYIGTKYLQDNPLDKTPGQLPTGQIPPDIYKPHPHITRNKKYTIMN